ncbi:MAG TPA: ABC transporter ATP-binding protein [Candidatus Saccharimonadales bacterium]|nr:ABC transporter ATP-binding protein [Candidatus Saccharimonadales bacterium]
MGKSEPILVVDHLSKTYGDKEVVKGISFEVKKGEIFGILGPNGAGKTTTLEMIEALRPIDGGSATLAGLNVKEQPSAVKEIIGIQLQSSNFFDKLTLVEQLNMFAGFYGVRINPMELLEEVELTDKSKSYYEHMSGGQKQRFSIATALVNKPKVLFLDEPTTGLDPQARRHLWDLVQRIRDKGITVILTTHYMEEAEVLCDRVAVMDAGEIIALDTPKHLINQLLKRGFKKPQVVQQATLEDVFIDLTGKDLRES